jgi:oligopeptide/dipeptide ABC transporter ATP-binding protein
MNDSIRANQRDPEAPLLELQELCVHFESSAGLARAVDGVSLRVEAGESVALMGESGCGKSLTALAIMGLLPGHAGIVESGDIRFQGHSLRDLKRLSEWRGERLAMIFQDPASALNPVFSVGEQIAESLRTKRGLGRREAALQAVRELGQVGLASPEARARQYPHQLSGGMQQRVMIAMAMCTRPELLIADEPTTALDVTVQAEILALMRELAQSHHMGMLLITHDIGVVAENAQRVAVMYAGKIVEVAAVDDLLTRPGHPYSKLLLRSLPELAEPGSSLPSITGSVPRAADFPTGCRFHPRCPLARERCRTQQPALSPVACHFPEEVPGL